MSKFFNIVTVVLYLFTQPAFSGVDQDIDVSKVQTMLAELCFDPGPVDGIWGRKTELAVIHAFEDNNLKFDGNFDWKDENFITTLKQSATFTPSKQCTAETVTHSFIKTTQQKSNLVPSKVSDTFEKLTKAEKQDIQYDLRILEFKPGIVDGVLGRSTYNAIIEYTENLGLDVASTSAEQIVKSLSIAADAKLKKQKRKLPKTWNFAVDFTQPKQLKQFDTQRLQSCRLSQCKSGFTPTEILTEQNGNKFISISSRENLQSNLNNTPADRNELGTRSIDFDLEGTVLWYGFKVKYPENFISQNAKGITFTQVKEVTKWRDPNNRGTKVNCSKGVIFHSQVQNNRRGFGGIYNGDGMHYPRRIENIKLIDKDWTTFKVGINFSRKNGSIEVYHNGRLIWRDQGANLVTRYNGNCSRGVNWRTAYLRIGVYRSNSPKGEDTLHFDDFVASHSEEVVDNFLRN